MTAKEKVERAAIGKAIAGALGYLDKGDRQKRLLNLVDIFQKIVGKTEEDHVFVTLRGLIRDDGKWMHYFDRLVDEVDPGVLKTTLLNLGYQAFFRGTKTIRAKRLEHKCNIPWVILMDPTSACNMHCTGCWAAEYGNQLNLSYEDMDSVITQGKELGCYFYMYTGGEPTIRKKDLIRLAEKHSECVFMVYTNGTLVDDAFCRDMVRVGNMMLNISVEGYAEENDSRRGEGSFDNIMKAMDLLKSYGLIFGTSICYTRANLETVTSDEFLDMLIEHGVRYSWYFHYMPVGNDASVDLLPTPEQREYIYHRLREIRAFEGGKEMFTVDFQNDGEYVGGCIAGGRNYFHINANGDCEPCVFIHYSSANIHEHTLLEVLKQPLFMAYRDGQPFNNNELRPCPMLENPELIKEMVDKTGAKSTDLQSPESVDHLCEKCHAYAEAWTPMAEKLWAENPHHVQAYENYRTGDAGSKATEIALRQQKTRRQHGLIVGAILAAFAAVVLLFKKRK